MTPPSVSRETPPPPPPPPAVIVAAPCESPRFTQSAEINRRASRANAELSRAIDLDEKHNTAEAITSYMNAAETYLQAIRLAEKSSSTITPVLKRRLEGALDRVETLKNPTSSSSSTRNLKSVVKQQSKTGDIRSIISNQDSIIKDTSSVASSSLTKEEVAVLKRSSLIVSGVFLAVVRRGGTTTFETSVRKIIFVET